MAMARTATWFGRGSKATTAQEIGALLARQAETASERLQSLATAFREAMPTNGAAALESARSYLEDHDVQDIGSDVADLIRRYPVQAILLGAGAGWVFARWIGRGRGRGTGGGQVKEVMTRNVEVIRPDTALRDGAARMADLDVGVLPVCDGERLVGMLTDRDIAIRAVARGSDPSTPVREIMSTSVRYAFEDEPIERVREQMTRHKIRRLPVLDANRRLIGIVSLGDLATEADTGRAGDVLEEVSAARATH